MKNVIIYDFDGTLTPYPLPRFEILENCGLENGALNPSYLEMAKKKAKEEQIDLYEAAYDIYFNLIKSANIPLIEESLCLGADVVTYNKGVREFLEFLNANGINNYLLSSGLKPYLEKTVVSSLF